MTTYILHIYGVNQDGEDTEIDCFEFSDRQRAYKEKADVYTSDYYSGIDGLYTSMEVVNG